MCGIVGYAGSRQALEVLLQGLKKLEYRGYDSAGIALMHSEQISVCKGAGEIKSLEEKINGNMPSGSSGIGHTRWATHGRPTDDNAHPHSSCCENFAVVHNGIIENYQDLRSWLEQQGHIFKSDTDTEVLAHLIEYHYRGELLEAVQESLELVEGSYAMVTLTPFEEGRLVCARKDSPLVVGLGEEENFIASDIPALLAHTRRVYILEDGETASITSSQVEVYNRQREKINKEVFQVNWDAVKAEKGGYPHFMLKEIMEQPSAVRETLRSRLQGNKDRVDLSEEIKLSPEEMRNVEKIHLVACGTAYHAGIVGKYAMEQLLRIKCEVDLGSEFRYRDPILDSSDLVVVISQSGETADTLAALRLAQEKGARVLAITNVLGSSVSREADDVLFTWAGPEIAVASTKAYLTQLIALYLLAFYLGRHRGTLEGEEADRLGRELASLPALVSRILQEERLEELKRYSRSLARWENSFFIGRNLDYAVAMEGALKLKEISYIHAEAYAAGELKHGTLALITSGIPVLALATQQHVLEKTISNIQEVKARDGDVFTLAWEGSSGLDKEVDRVFYLPRTSDILAPVLAVVPLQLISYYTAVERGCPVDKPRNLAKSVTVE